MKKRQMNFLKIRLLIIFFLTFSFTVTLLGQEAKEFRGSTTETSIYKITDKVNSIETLDQLNLNDGHKGMKSFPGYNPKYIDENKDFTAQLDKLNELKSSKLSVTRKEFWEQYEIEALPTVDMGNEGQVEVIENLKKFYNSIDPLIQEVFSLSDLWYIYLRNEDLVDQFLKFN